MVYKFFGKKSTERVLLLNQIISLQINSTGRSLENIRDEESIHLLETIFKVLI